MRNPTAPPPTTYPVPPTTVSRSRVVVPSPDEPPLALVLTCGSSACQHTFEPDPVAFAAHRLVCPRCGGWTFHAELVEPGLVPGAPIPYVLTDAAAGGAS